LVDRWGNCFIWPRTGMCGGLLWMRPWTFGVHKEWGISWPAGELFVLSKGCSLWSSFVNVLFASKTVYIVWQQACWRFPDLCCRNVLVGTSEVRWSASHLEGLVSVTGHFMPDLQLR
jgi:hypothetical protein